MSASFTPSEMMTIAAARALKSTDVCFVGIGAPSAACNLARLTHAPGVTLIYESGTIATKPNVLPLSSIDVDTRSSGIGPTACSRFLQIFCGTCEPRGTTELRDHPAVMFRLTKAGQIELPWNALRYIEFTRTVG